MLSSEAPPCNASDILVGTAGISRIQHPVQRAAHAGRATVQDVRVDLRRRHVAVPLEFLDGPDVAAVLRKCVANEWRSVWGPARLAIPVRHTACFTARCKTDSCR